jgi:catalase
MNVARSATNAHEDSGMEARRTKTQSDAAAGQMSTPEQLVDALNMLFGKQTDNRAVHATGIVLEGTFTPTPDAASLSKAPHFMSAVPVIARFSNFAGKPGVPHTDPLASPRGLALKFKLPDGSDTDLVTHSFNGFPVATADQFRELLIALATSGPDARKPTPADLFLAAHPIAKAFLEHQAPPPRSYATLAYFGVNSFEFTNADGVSTIGRFRIEPELGIQLLPATERATAAPDYLFAEILDRVSSSPVRFTVRVQLAEPGDAIADPSIAWPDDRTTIDVGTLELRSVVPDSEGAERALLFLPGALPPGIAPADPMIQARQDSYPISFDRRHGKG